PGLSPLPQAALGRSMQLPQTPLQPGAPQANHQQQGRGKGAGAGGRGGPFPRSRSVRCAPTLAELRIALQDRQGVQMSLREEGRHAVLRERCGRCGRVVLRLQDTLQTAERLTGPFMRSLEASGWRIEKIVVEAEKRRARW
ncbi:hypothetical protein QJQ45_027174, partial [Haematococcus lacustris]